jgi:hypothetical protein
VRTLLLDTWYGYETARGVRTADRDFVESGLPADRFRDDVVAAARRLADYIGAVGPDTPRGTYLCHSFCELGARPFPQTLRDINEFLDRNPGEVIMLVLEDHISPEDTAKAFISSGLIGRVYYHTDGQPFPTLREMIETDERVVVFAENNASGVDWYLPASEFIQDTPFRVMQPGQFSCELGRGEATNPIFALNHWLTASFPSRPDASEINQFDFLYQRALRCEAARERRVNLVIVNFYSLGDAKLVVDVLNGVAEPPNQETVSRQGN